MPAADPPSPSAGREPRARRGSDRPPWSARRAEERPTPRRRFLALATLATILPLGLGCAPDDGSVTGDRPPNLVLVVVDTLRADRLGVYGYDQATSPALDRLAGEAAVFTQARAQAPCTFPSVNSLLTSRPTWTFAGRDLGDLGIPRDVPTLASRLRRAGYRTAAVSASPVVRQRPSVLNREGGFDGGFDLFLDGCLWQDGRCVGERAESLLGVLAEPFFLYLHYLDPHDPYRAPLRRPDLAGPPPAGASAAVASGDPLAAAERLYRQGDAGLTAAELAHLSDRYDEEVAFADRQVGALYEALDERRLLDRTLLAVTSDHGESFLEHGHLRHCRSLHDEELRVPLLLRLPDTVTRHRGARLDHPVPLLDLTPTLLDYAGALDPRDGWAGESLRPALEGQEPPASRPVLASSGTRRAWVAEGWKLIHDLDARAGTARSPTQLFDLRADPGETRDLAADHPEVTRRLLAALDRHLRRVEGTGLESSPDRLDRSRETERQLRALGYLQ